MITLCEFPGCIKEQMSLGLCRAHYGQQYRGHKLKPLRQPSYEWTGWHKNSKGYVLRRRNIRGENRREVQWQHRMVMEEMLGRPLTGIENVHHINGVRDDNRPENLELWVVKQPRGQRPQDLVDYAREILSLYG